MSKETNLRYEQPHRPSKLFQEYTKNLKANDDYLIKDIDQNVLDQKQLHDKWFEKSHIKVRAKQYQTHQKILADEIKQVSKASMLVRKDALKKLIEAEQEAYKEELHQSGKTFHVQRI